MIGNRMSFASLAALVACAPSGYGDTVILRNGAAIDGLIIRQDDRFITLRIGENGQIWISLRDIARTERNARRARSNVGEANAQEGEPRRESEASAAPPPPAPGDPTGSPPPGPVAGPPSSGETREEKPSDAEVSPEPRSVKPAAGEAQGNTRDFLSPAEREEIESLVRELERQRARNRTRAENRLRAFGEKAVPFLIPCLDAESPATRAAAMRILAETRDERIVGPAIARLRDEDPFVREAAIQGLKNFAGEELGYAPRGPEAGREAAVARWERWWAEREGKRPAAR